MRLVIFVSLMFLSFGALADTGTDGFFSYVTEFFYDIYTFIFVVIPTKIGDFFVWLSAYLLYMKFYFMYESMLFAHDVALTFLGLLDLTSVINTAVSALPADLRQAAHDMRFFDAFTLVVEALITRMVFTMGNS